MNCEHGWIVQVASAPPDPQSDEWSKGPVAWPDWCAACAFPELPHPQQVEKASARKADRERAETPAAVYLFANGNFGVCNVDGNQMPWLQGGDWRRKALRAIVPSSATASVTMNSQPLTWHDVPKDAQ